MIYRLRNFYVILFTCLVLTFTVSAAANAAEKNTKNLVGKYSHGPGYHYGNISANGHEQSFTNNPYEGTASCLKCHVKEAEDILKIGHWNWQGIADNVVDVKNEIHGKNDFINNFCVAVPSDEGRCAQCHIGYG